MKNAGIALLVCGPFLFGFASFDTAGAIAFTMSADAETTTQSVSARALFVSAASRATGAGVLIYVDHYSIEGGVEVYHHLSIDLPLSSVSEGTAVAIPVPSDAAVVSYIERTKAGMRFETTSASGSIRVVDYFSGSGTPALQGEFSLVVVDDARGGTRRVLATGTFVTTPSPATVRGKVYEGPAYSGVDTSVGCGGQVIVPAESEESKGCGGDDATSTTSHGCAGESKSTDENGGCGDSSSTGGSEGGCKGDSEPSSSSSGSGCGGDGDATKCAQFPGQKPLRARSWVSRTIGTFAPFCVPVVAILWWRAKAGASAIRRRRRTRGRVRRR